MLILALRSSTVLESIEVSLETHTDEMDIMPPPPRDVLITWEVAAVGGEGPAFLNPEKEKTPFSHLRTEDLPLDTPSCGVPPWAMQNVSLVLAELQLEQTIRGGTREDVHDSTQSHMHQNCHHGSKPSQVQWNR